MKKLFMKKTLIMIITMLMCLVLFSGMVQAIGMNVDGFGGTKPNSAGQIQSAGNVIIGTIQVVAIAIAVVILVALAVKYIVAAPSEKADVKKSAVTYVIGAILLFSGTAALEILQGVGNQIDGGSNSSTPSIEAGPQYPAPDTVALM